MRRTISNILIIIFSAIIAFSGFRLYTIFHEYHEGEKQYEETIDELSRMLGGVTITDAVRQNAIELKKNNQMLLQ